MNTALLIKAESQGIFLLVLEKFVPLLKSSTDRSEQSIQEQWSDLENDLDK